MYDYIDDERLVEDIKTISKVPSLRAALFHKIEDYKGQCAKEIEEYRELEHLIEPKEKSEDSVNVINFEMRKKGKGWMVNPVIYKAIVNHILSQNAKPGIIKMEKFKLPGGQKVDLSFEKQTEDYFTGSIKEKVSQKGTQQAKPSPIKKTGKKTKIEDLKTFLTYLLNNENLCNSMLDEFYEKWKPLIDNDCIINEG